VPQTRTEWWLNKIETNKSNYSKNVRSLKNNGWSVITIWECQLKPAKIKKTIRSLNGKLLESI
jgi:DNA mismatch endonuclease (patch repair protein)